MKTNIISIPGYQVNEYQLILLPHEELRNKIFRVREEFRETYLTGTGKSPRPQLTLAFFQQHQMLEERIVNRLKTIALGQYPFKVELRDYGSFPSHTVFINVLSKVPVQSLIKTVRHDLQRLLKPDEEHKPYFNLEPHMVIGTKLKPWQYEKAWLDYSVRHFTGRFIADRMILLKKGPTDAAFHTIGSFAFENLPVAVKQGDLFA